jgi:hypothetical protein
MCSLTLLFYQLSEKFDDDLRIISYFIDEKEAKKIYKSLLRGNFDRYAIILKQKIDNFNGDLEEWKADTMVKLDFSREDLFVHSDFENIEG